MNLKMGRIVSVNEENMTLEMSSEGKGNRTIIIRRPSRPMGKTVSHTLPFILGFIMGMVFPVIWLAATDKLVKETLLVELPWLMNISHYNPTFVLMFFAVSVIALVFLYWIHTHHCAEVAKVDQKRLKDELDAETATIKNALDVFKDKVQARGETININMLMEQEVGDDTPDKNRDSHRKENAETGVNTSPDTNRDLRRKGTAETATNAFKSEPTSGVVE